MAADPVPSQAQLNPTERSREVQLDPTERSREVHVNPTEVQTIEDLGRVLRQLRRRQARRRGDSELTYRELAARTGWSIGIIAGYFAGRTLPPTDRFDVLVGLLDVTPAEQGALATARDRVAERRRQDPAPARPVPRQLPADMPGFTGRTAALAELDALLDRAGGAVVLSGTAGVGKTALAVHWAHRVADRFPDGQLYVNLRGFDPNGSAVGPADAVRGFLDAFGVAPQRLPAPEAAQVGLYRSLLAGRRILVLVDNARDAEQVRPLLPGTPGCLTVVTSRNQLASLVATEGAHSLSLDLLPMAEARELLAGRLGADRVAAEPEAVDEVITRCARLPLALAVTAARAAAQPTFPLARLAAQLREAGGLEPFVGDDAAADVRAVFSWSYRGLSPAAARLFRQLGTHPGPDLAEPAAASLAGLGVTAVRGLLAELARAHLVREHIPGRYACHDLLRAYATEQAHTVDSAADRRAALRRGLDHYLHTAHAAALLLYPHRDPVPLDPAGPGARPEPLATAEDARAWFTAEHRVLLAAVEQAAETGFGGHAWRLAWALGDVLDWSGHWHDLAATQGIALDAATRDDDHPGQAHANRNLARAYNRLGRHALARTHLQRAVRLFAAASDHSGQAHSHIDLALVLEGQGRHRDALRLSREALDLFRAQDNRAGLARSLNVVGWYHGLLGDHAEALACCQQALALHQAIGNRRGEAATWDSLGYAHQHLGSPDEAAACYRQAIDLYHDTGDRFHIADTLIHLGEARLSAGADEAARDAWGQALDILDELHHPAAAELRARLEFTP